MMTTRFILATLLAAPSLAIAGDEPTAEDVDGAPAPGNESGRLDPIDDGDGTGRWIARGLLFVPRVAVTAVLAPVEGGAWALERYQLIDRVNRLFFNDAGTLGLFPTFQHDSGFGVNIGARLVHRDMFGAREKMDLRTSSGGRFHQRHAMAFSSGERLGKHTVLRLASEYEQRPKDSFYGIGDGDAMTIAAPLDPNSGMIGTATRFRHRIARAIGSVQVRPTDRFQFLGAASVADHEFDTSETGTPIGEVYQTDRLAGFQPGTRYAYGELEVRWDTRRRAVDREPLSVVSTGTLAAAFAGRTTALDDGADYWRYGVDLQRFFRVGAGPRVLSFRAHGEAVTGRREDVPFTELPRLGGKDLMRGYAIDRFRDRIAAVASADYSFDLSANISASLFVDAGRAYEAFSDISSSDLRVGYGLSLDLHSRKSFLARASVASSIDGGVVFNFALDPVFELDGRVQRR